MRVRPPNRRELSGMKAGLCLAVPEGPAIQGEVIVPSLEKDNASPFLFDYAFGLASSQLDVFCALGIDLVA